MKAMPALLAMLALLAGCGDTPTAQPSSPPPVPPPTQQPTPSTTTPTTTTPSSAPTTPSSAPTTPSCLDQKLESLTPREEAAQLIMTGVDSLGMTQSERQAITTQQPGSLLLIGHSRSAAHARDNLKPAIAAATVKGIQPLVAADQEGGQIQRFKGPGFDHIPAATVQGTWSPSKLTSNANTWGSQLKSAGVNLDLAPVADVVPANLRNSNAPIGALDREYGSTPDVVGASVTAFVKGMHQAGVLTSVKHFPGLGRVRGNTDFTAGVTDTVTTRRDPDLAPFTAGIKAGADLVMVSTVTYQRIDPGNRAVFSPTIIEGMLRGDLGYTGVVISDDVGAAKEVATVPPEERATRFVAAGGDIVITAKAQLTEAMVTGLVAKAQQDQAFAAKVQSSVRRVLTLKQENGLVTC